MGTRSRSRREDDEETRAAPPAPPAPVGLAEALEDMQRRAGNRATAAALARDPDPSAAPGAAPGGWQFSPFAPGAAPQPNLKLPADYVEKREAAILARVRAHVDQQRQTMSERIRAGISIAEVVDMVIRGVPEAREVPLETLSARIREMFAPLEIQTHRNAFDTAGVKSEIESQARLALPSLSGTPKVERPPGQGGYMKVGLSGVAVGVRKGETEVEAGTSWTGTAKLSTRVGQVLFEAALSPPKGEGSPEWEVSLQFPGEDGLVPALDQLPKVFGEAEKGLRNAAGEMVRRGDKGIGAAAGQMGAVKTAVEALSTVSSVKPGGPHVGVKVEGQGPAVTIQATLTILF